MKELALHLYRTSMIHPLASLGRNEFYKSCSNLGSLAEIHQQAQQLPLGEHQFQPSLGPSHRKESQLEGQRVATGQISNNNTWLLPCQPKLATEVAWIHQVFQEGTELDDRALEPQL